MKKFFKRVRIEAYYNLNGMYMKYPTNELHGQEFINVDVEITKEQYKIAGFEIEEDVIYIDGVSPIGCELVGKVVSGDTLLLKICQDWG